MFVSVIFAPRANARPGAAQNAREVKVHAGKRAATGGQIWLWLTDPPEDSHSSRVDCLRLLRIEEGPRRGLKETLGEQQALDKQATFLNIDIDPGQHTPFERPRSLCHRSRN